MKKNKKRIYKWRDPLKIAQYLEKIYNPIFFLYSGSSSQKNRYSIIAFDISEEKTFSKFADIKSFFSKLESKANCFFDMLIESYFGFFSYCLKNSLEELPADEKTYVHIPLSYFANFNKIILFDHENKIVTTNYENFIDIKESETSVSSNIEILKLESNFSKEEYQNAIVKIKREIEDGNVYQANLTRKFFGELKEGNFDLFNQFIITTNLYPTSYSAYIKIGESVIASFSPEQFIKIAGNNASCEPIKGTAKKTGNDFKRGADIYKLLNSDKDLSENLMIVDLIRNDFSKVCIPNSVHVPKLFQLLELKNLYHIYSRVEGVIKNNLNNIDLIEACFPAGSMTGAPKISAMIICSQLEKLARGLYSGALGYYHKQICDFSVVIRTIIFNNNKFEFQVGGGIVYDSSEDGEYEETLVKLEPIKYFLGLNDDQIEDL